MFDLQNFTFTQMIQVGAILRRHGKHARSWEDQSMNGADRQNRRPSQRVPVHVAVFIVAETLQAQAFTRVSNAYGGLPNAPFRMMVGQSIALFNAGPGKEARRRVVRIKKRHDGSLTTAFEFDGPGSCFWPLYLPPTTWGVAQEVT